MYQNPVISSNRALPWSQTPGTDHRDFVRRCLEPQVGDRLIRVEGQVEDTYHGADRALHWEDRLFTPIEVTEENCADVAVLAQSYWFLYACPAPLFKLEARLRQNVSKFRSKGGQLIYQSFARDECRCLLTAGLELDGSRIVDRIAAQAHHLNRVQVWAIICGFDHVKPYSEFNRGEPLSEEYMPYYNLGWSLHHALQPAPR